MRKKYPSRQRAAYLLIDAISAWTAYTALYSFRKAIIETQALTEATFYFSNQRYWLGSLLVICFWISLHYLTGFYKDAFRRSRIRDLTNTMATAIAGTIVLFFALILDDFVASYKDYYSSFGFYFVCQFGITALGRTIITSIAAHRIKNRIIGFPTLMVGSNSNAVDLYNDLESQTKSVGFQFVGFVSVNNNVRFLMERNLQHLGEYTEINKIIDSMEIEEVIIAIETREHDKLERILNILKSNSHLRIHVIPDTYDIISGQVRLESFGAPLVEIKQELLPIWQKVAKRLLDIVLSLFLLLLLSPLLLFSAVMVKFTSTGSILFLQERIGLNGRKFNILKFRSMFIDAESNGPQLSSKNDHRITAWGKFMRKYRLDELPQFLNVLAGDMSIVGPRPERAYYIEKITEKAPHYVHLQKVKPGITSWGMVKFGYAENVDEMVQRLKYDIIYIENMNMINDLKILIYTVLIVLQGRGK